MTKINWKPGTMLSPLPPVLVSCGTVDKPNVMTVAWTGIISSDPVITYVSIRPQRFSHDIIKESGEFVINLPTWNMVTAVDFCGVKSGRDVNKFKEMNLTALPCPNVKAPQIEECPVSIECKLKSVTNYCLCPRQLLYLGQKFGKFRFLCQQSQAQANAENGKGRS